MHEFSWQLEHENTKTVYFHTDTQSDLNGWISSLQQAAMMKGNSGLVLSFLFLNFLGGRGLIVLHACFWIFVCVYEYVW